MELSDSERFGEEASRASMDGRRIRVTLLDGEVIEGTCTGTDVDLEGAALPNATPVEERMFGPGKRIITIADRTIPAADVAALEVLD